MDHIANLAAVTADAVDRFRAATGDELDVARLATCPHDLVNLEIAPLGEVLAEVIDVGQPLRNTGWHPLRAPVVIDPETAMARSLRLDEACRTAAPELVGMLGDVVGADVEGVRALYEFARANR